MATYSLETQLAQTVSATTTTILSKLADAADEKRVKAGMLKIRNIGASNNTITLQLDSNDGSGTDYELSEVTLGAGDEWQNPWDVTLTTANHVLEMVTSSTSAIDVVCNYLLKDDS